MGWRPSTTDDVVVCVLRRHGPLTARGIQDEINEFDCYMDWWVAAHGNWRTVTRWEGEPPLPRDATPEPVGYQEIYQRLHRIEVVERAGKTTVKGQGGCERPGSILWRVMSRLDLIAAERAERERLKPTEADVALAQALEETIGHEVQLRVEARERWVVVKMARQDVTVALGVRTWREALVAVGAPA